MKELFKLNKRDIQGVIGWLFVSQIIGLIALPIMVGREIYQWKHYNLARFEWEDIIRYSLVIILGSLSNYRVIQWIIN